jgi:hypothetical protein
MEKEEFLFLNRSLASVNIKVTQIAERLRLSKSHMAGMTYPVRLYINASPLSEKPVRDRIFKVRVLDQPHPTPLQLHGPRINCAQQTTPYGHDSFHSFTLFPSSVGLLAPCPCLNVPFVCARLQERVDEAHQSTTKPIWELHCFLSAVAR